MASYVIFVFSSLTPSEELEAYAAQAPAVIERFGGRFLVRGEPYEVLEGDWPGPVVVLQFPDRATARRWYDSEDYQRLVPLRRGSSTVQAILVDQTAGDGS